MEWLSALRAVGNTVSFGQYEQDNDLQNGPEPIEWIVLDVQNGKSLLLSKYILNAVQFNEERKNVTWETSSLRSWLNESFINEAFNSIEQQAIIASIVDNSREQAYDWSVGGNDTVDKAFILNREELKLLAGIDGRTSKATLYAIQHGVNANDENGCSCWWLRLIDEQQKAAFVNFDGGLSGWRTAVDSITIGVRPAIWVDNTGLSTKGYEVAFGRYEQDNNLENGPEPIEWIVLDAQDGKSLLLSKYGLDAKAFHEMESVAYWDSCTLRKWLNGAFLQDAFSKKEQQAILSTKVDNSKEQGNPSWETSDRTSTTDTSFLLSYAEISSYFHNDIERRCKPTAFAIAEGVNLNGEHSWWWTRSASSGNYLNYAGTISPEGSTKTTKNVNSVKGAVRPAIWVDQEKLKFAQEQIRLSDEVSKATLNSSSPITFGRYEQDNNMENGAEPIEWILLESKGNKHLLLSRYVLDWKAFDESGKAATWDYSSLRTWLNQEFLETAFSEPEKKQIGKNYVDNSYGQGVPGINVYAGGNTSDSSFILSYAEAQRFFTTDEDRTATQTEFAKSQGVGKGDTCRWWLRSPGTANKKEKGMCAILSDGKTGTFFRNTTLQGVRPAIWIDLDAVYK